ncbi:preprotein translocase subunit SecA [Candidatus Poribacteria bacterium]|nr:preprotein translocase subunit SecA [Candidatus Poribacteria bacterium]
MFTIKRYRKLINKIKSFELKHLDDVELLSQVDPWDVTRTFAIIREVVGRRIGMWKLFDSDLLEDWCSKSSVISKSAEQVEELRKSVDDWDIYLDGDFYQMVQEMRKSQDDLTFWPFDVQLIGALAMYNGNIAEMGTGEGKTLAAVFPTSMWALSGKKVHIATVNDYLALRDYEWMAPVYRFLGLSVGCVLQFMDDTERREAYLCDIVYASNYELGFDYLRDQVKADPEKKVQDKLQYVIIDEIDSILMDEATTPMIISGSSEYESDSLYQDFHSFWRLKPAVEYILNKQQEIVHKLLVEAKDEKDDYLKAVKMIQVSKADPLNNLLLEELSKDSYLSEKRKNILSKFRSARSEYKLERGLFYVVDENQRTIKLTDQGYDEVEQILDKAILENSLSLRNLLLLLRACILHKKDEDYIVQNGNVIIVDEYTGRLAFGKKYEEGLHQAIECKENLEITEENRVIGRITQPNYFRLYENMTGMTATAYTEAQEFKRLYKLDIVRIPPNKPLIRVDLPDKFYRTEIEKLEAIVNDVIEHHKIGRPVLIGARSVEKSQRLSEMLSEMDIPHNLLNAKNHFKEAEIIKDAGRPYAVTIATNMAGRGTDIILGDSRLGLHVIGTERHRARRIDKQLIGRAGRQGDPGSSRFYLSLEDDLFRIFGQEEFSRMAKALDESNFKLMEKLTLQAQYKSEESGYETRKYLLEYDNVTHKQREVIHELKQEAIKGKWTIKELRSIIIDEYVSYLVDTKFDLNYLREYCFNNFGVKIPDININAEPDEAKENICNAFEKTYWERLEIFGKDFCSRIIQAVLVKTIEEAWTDYLSYQGELQKSFMLRHDERGKTIAKYRLESAEIFEDLINSIRRETLKDIFTYPLPGVRISNKMDRELIDDVKNLLSV